ncbi:MAG: alpha-N-acetylglucosaminidase [Bacteroidaceae bacterium]|nr:alpha-N-acetylglucosaminidase [Bacteroidaceae bacterium]
MTPMRYTLLLVLVSALSCVSAANPLTDLLERVDEGASAKFRVELQAGDRDFFELDQCGSKVVVRGNTYCNIGAGLNWYLRHYCGIHLSWNNMKADLPDTLPPVRHKERHETDMRLRYYLNYCTFSYSMAFWDWDRWQQEIDWMVLHGINLPLAAVGHECVWRNMLLRMGKTEEEVGRFIPGPAFFAWWEMGNLEGWGGPLPLSWYAQQEKLQKQILRRMRAFGMKPVLPGYGGMIQSADVTDGSRMVWNGFVRPGTLMPDDPRFDQYARLFYEETERLYGKADYYSTDPFHEAGAIPAGFDFGVAGKAILATMRKYGNEDAVWVLQGWGGNPRQDMLNVLPKGSVLVLDLNSETVPQFGPVNAAYNRREGYGIHDWCFCELENFGGNVGLHGRFDMLVDHYTKAREHFSANMKGIGLTMEGIENNQMMYELMTDLPWIGGEFRKVEWVSNYVNARYGLVGNKDVDRLTVNHHNPVNSLYMVWNMLANSIYNSPEDNWQQGTHESIFCARPSKNAFQVSSWSQMKNYYDPNYVFIAQEVMEALRPVLGGNDNFDYDYVDITRQANAEKGRRLYEYMMVDFRAHDSVSFEKHKSDFLDLILAQDSLLSTRSEFTLDRWLTMARDKGQTVAEKEQYEWNARVQITTWGNRECSDGGGLHDYAHKEWAGLLRDFYHQRWKKYLDMLSDVLAGKCEETRIDWYDLDEKWVRRNH